MAAFNETTGDQYQGKNVARLLEAESAAEYDERRGWAGYRQWIGAGRVVRRGEHGTACVTVVSAGATTDPATGERVGGTRKPRGFRVFHWDQTTELGAEETVSETAGVVST